ncbi:hypothetical protein Scep_017180 [Stephania cephalantha]|uniref:Uncharacterized protein n=1 Tax=Stephania cephalantha TaxID=152367 RepID=A0AAP0IQY2_9MAGN
MLATVKPITPSEFVSHLPALPKTYKEASLPKPAVPTVESANASPSTAITPDIATTILQQLQQMEKQIEDKMEAKLKQIEDLYSATSRTSSEGEATSAAPDFIEL